MLEKHEWMIPETEPFSRNYMYTKEIYAARTNYKYTPFWAHSPTPVLYMILDGSTRSFSCTNINGSSSEFLAQDRFSDYRSSHLKDSKYGLLQADDCFLRCNRRKCRYCSHICLERRTLLHCS